MTIGCILATLFIKALTIGPMIKKMKIDALSPFRKAYNNDLGLYYLVTERHRILDQKKRGYIQNCDFDIISKKIENKIKDTLAIRKEMAKEYGNKLSEQTLRYAAINIEFHYLQELYNNDEIDEIIYRKINGKLSLQIEKIEHGKFEEIDPSLYIDRKDIFERLMIFIQFKIARKNAEHTVFQKISILSSAVYNL